MREEGVKEGGGREGMGEWRKREEREEREEKHVIKESCKTEGALHSYLSPCWASDANTLV